LYFVQQGSALVRTSGGRKPFVRPASKRAAPDVFKEVNDISSSTESYELLEGDSRPGSSVLAEYSSLAAMPDEEFAFVEAKQASRILFLIRQLRLTFCNYGPRLLDRNAPHRLLSYFITLECTMLFIRARTKWSLIPSNSAAEHAMSAARDLDRTVSLNVVNLVFYDIINGRIIPDLWLLNLLIIEIHRLEEYRMAKDMWTFYCKNLGRMLAFYPSTHNS
jgi:hypothetical protein